MIIDPTMSFTTPEIELVMTTLSARECTATGSNKMTIGTNKACFPTESADNTGNV